MASNLHKDFLASYLRSHLSSLQSVLNEIESSEKLDDDYIEQSLRRAEKEIHQIIKFTVSN